MVLIAICEFKRFKRKIVYFAIGVPPYRTAPRSQNMQNTKKKTRFPKKQQVQLIIIEEDKPEDVGPHETPEEVVLLENYFR